MGTGKVSERAPAADDDRLETSSSASGATTKRDPELDERLVAERQANREGPSHPAHAFHDRWLADRGLDRSYDQNHWTRKAT